MKERNGGLDWLSCHFLFLTMIMRIMEYSDLIAALRLELNFNASSAFSSDPVDTSLGYVFFTLFFSIILGRHIGTYGFFRYLKAWQWGIVPFKLSQCAMRTSSWKPVFGGDYCVVLSQASIVLLNAFIKINFNALFFSLLAPYTFVIFLISDRFYISRYVYRLINDFEKEPDSCATLFVVVLNVVVVTACCMLIQYAWKRILGELNLRIAASASNGLTRLCNETVDFDSVRKKMRKGEAS